MSTRSVPTRSIHSRVSTGLEQLDPDDRDEVFDEEEDGAEEAIDDESFESPELLDELLTTTDLLLAADRRLAEVAIQDAQAAIGDEDEIDEDDTDEDDIEDAFDELEEAIDAVDD